ncbi:MAG: SAM-dependent methyltransferase [Chelatococcus sp.]|nr:MAG: SAM-dependent methyltransferase [Chelatococcus sp.]
MSESWRDVVDLYERHALAFDGERGRTLMERSWLERFLALLPEQAEVLDIGCGSGEPLAAHLVGRGCRLTGIDSSATLIGLCRRRFPKHDWHVADMRGLALGRKFDGLLAWDSFFHLRADDQRAMFPVFREHAAAGAALMFTSGPAGGEALGSYRGETLYHASLDPQEYADLLGAAGFDVVAYRPDDAECGGHTVWLARFAGA